MARRPGAQPPRQRRGDRARGAQTAGLAGEPAPDNEFNQRVWDRWNALDGPAQAAGFLDTNERLVSTLEGLPAQTRERASFTWFLPFPVGIEIFAGMRLSELAQHAWDVRVAFDPTDSIPDDVAGTMLDVLTGPASFMVGFVGRGDERASAATALEVRTTGPERRFGLTLGPQVAVGPAPDAADGTLTAPAEAVVRLIGGRLRPEHTPTTSSSPDRSRWSSCGGPFPGSDRAAHQCLRMTRSAVPARQTVTSMCGSATSTAAAPTRSARKKWSNFWPRRSNPVSANRFSA